MALLCLSSGTFLLGFMAAILNIFEMDLSERASYLSWEDWSGLGVLLLIGLGTIICSLGLFRQQRWAVALITLILAVIMLIVMIALLSDLRLFVTDPLDAFCILLGGCGIPFCLILLFNSVQVLPWLSPSSMEEGSILDEL